MIEKRPGRSYPLGATFTPKGVNFSVFSKNCSVVELVLFDNVTDASPAEVIPLNPERNRTFYYWHVLLPKVQAGQLYGYRVYGDYTPERGLYFDGSKVLLDPYARAVTVAESYRREALLPPRPGRIRPEDTHALKSVVVDSSAYDWEGDKPLLRPYASTVIYEVHVGGFTRHPNSGVAPERRGTYAGLVEKIPYLQELGITAVELLPVQQFDPQDAPPGYTNYWGYSPIALFAPHAGYSSRSDPLGPVNEFRDMVKALHRAGIQVILDVVFNHTAESGRHGPTISLRGLENKAYYILKDDLARYANYSGCGNTLNTNHSIVRRMIMDCLRYWVSEMHVDGFRFDLASVMARDEWGKPLKSPPILWEIESDPVLAGTKIIAEAWDAGGLYQVGTFVGHRWAEWNGRFRDDVRRFVKSDAGMVGPMAARLKGSPDLYRRPDGSPYRSVNFVTCHDGFTLNDLVSYNEKHNEANGEGNRDGTDANYSWNCGFEGPTGDPQVEALRLRQIKNFLTILFLSQGTPMLLMGDEVRRTQWGNNNAYCQDNELSWFDWEGLERHAGLLRFVRTLIDCTQGCPIFSEERFWTASRRNGAPHIVWHGIRPYRPDWGRDSRSLAFELRDPGGQDYLYVMLNAYWKPLTFTLPDPPAGRRWCRFIDTAFPTPDDIVNIGAEPAVEGEYWIAERAVVVLTAKGS